MVKSKYMNYEEYFKISTKQNSLCILQLKLDNQFVSLFDSRVCDTKWAARLFLKVDIIAKCDARVEQQYTGLFFSLFNIK